MAVIGTTSAIILLFDFSNKAWLCWRNLQLLGPAFNQEENGEHMNIV
jgi:hypothetical protein